MRKLFTLKAFILLLFLGFSSQVNSQLLVDDFTYSGNLTSNGWIAHSGASTNPIATTTPGLIYTGYPGNSGNSSLLKNTSGEDINKRFTSQSTNGQSVYFSFLVNVNDISTSKSGDYFIHIGNNTSVDGTGFTNFSARVFARISSSNVNFGLSNSSTATYGITNFSKNTTYLLVVKYTINTAGADNTSLYIFSSGVPSSEATAGIPEVTNTATSGQDAINAVALRQGTTSQPQVVVDGLRVGTSFTEVTSEANTVQLSVNSNSGSESAGSVITVTATASQTVVGDQYVSLQVTGSNITNGDYTLSNAIITIPNGSRTGTATFTIIDDVVIEGTETATLTISNPSSGISLGDTKSQNVNIIDNDAATVSVQSGVNAAEPSTNGTFTINFNTPTTVSTDINFAFSGTSVFGSDYTISFSTGTTTSSTSSGTLTVPAGISSVTVNVLTADDESIEGTESIILTISSPTGGYVVGTSNATINLADNDVLKNVSVSNTINAAEPGTNGTYTVTLTAPAPSGGVTINYTLSGTATISSDYSDLQNGSITIPEGSTSGIVTISTIDDVIFEPTETVIITLISATNGFTIIGPPATNNLSDNEVILFGGSYSQDFNSLINTGTVLSWINNNTINGWYANRTTYNAGDGSVNTGALYSFGVNSSSERALGSTGSGSTGTVYYGVRLKNNTGTTITNLQVSYTGEQWRNGNNTSAQTVNFAYQISTTFTNITAGTWTAVSNLNFTSPVTGTTATGLNGNDPANSTSIIYNISGLNIPAGQEFFLRWEDFDNSGNDHGLGIDDLVITNQVCATPTAKPTALTFGTSTETSIQGSFTAASPAADKYLVVISSGNALTSDPVNGHVYQIGDNLGDGTVVGYSTSINFTATNLSAGTLYYFFVFPVNSACIGGPNYLVTEPLTSSSSTDAGLPPCTSPATQASNLVLSNPSINSVQGSFTLAEAANEYIILRSTSSTLTNDPVNGQTYNAGAVIGNATVVQRNATNTFTATGLAPNTQYYFFVFSLNSQNCLNGPSYNVTSPASASLGTLPLPECTVPTSQPTNLILNSTNTKITGTFNAGTGADSYLVIRSTSSSLSSSPVDNIDYNPGDNIGGGIVVANSASTSFISTGLNQATTYYIFIYANNNNCTGGTKYLNASPLTANITTTSTPPNFVYFGNLHSHSDYSDGNKDNPGYTPALDYQYAKDAECLDFLGISEHNHYSGGDPGNLITNYHKGLTQADNFNAVNPNFVALYGMEWGTISGGGHVVIYGDGLNKLYGWESNVGGISGPNYDVFVQKGDYRGASGLFKTINDDITTNTFATLAHPNSNDFNNLSNTAYDVIADNAIVGTAVESGPAFSTNTTYSNPASSLAFKWYYDKLLAKGYHLGPNVDHDNHNTTFGKTTRSRTAVIAPALNRTEIVKAMREMRFYSTEDCDAIVDFSINTKIMGTTFADRNAPTISASLTDFTTNTSNALIRVKFGIPGSDVLPITVDSVYGSSLSYVHNDLPINATGYYYIHITNGDAEIITSPIWYTRLCVNTTTTNIVACESYTWASNGKTYTESGEYIHSYTDQGGCSNTDNLSLTITHPSTGDTTAIACDSFTWYGDTFTESGTPIKILKGYGGCDSTVTLHLTINHSSSSSESATACDSYTWHGNTYTATGDYTYESQNAEGCTNTATLHLTIEDTEDPTITAPPNVSVDADNGSCEATGVDLGTPITADNCTVASVTNDHSSTNYPVGSTIVTWTVTDTHGRTATATQTVTVIDDQNPTITAPANVSVNADNGSCEATGVDLGTPITADNCGVETVTNDHPSTSYPVGSTIVTWTVTDTHGRTATATQTVTVTDDQNPTITAPATVSVNADNERCEATGVDIGTPITADNCGVASVTNNHSSTNYPVGTTIVTWTVTDTHGRTATATQTVTVTDDQNPTITAPATVSVNADNGKCEATGVNLGTPATADNCSVASVTNDHSSIKYPVGSTIVTWTVTDTHGRTATAMQTVNITDNQSPVITTNGNKNVTADAGQCGAALSVSASAEDNCGPVTPSGTRSDNLALSAQYPVGTTTITWTVTDANYNTTTAMQTVTVTDNQYPVITTNGNKNVTADAGQCGAAVSVSATAADNCGPVTPSGTRSDNLALSSQYPVGTTTVTWTVTDTHGNTATATQTVTVTDNQNPVITYCPLLPVQCYNTSGSYSVPLLTATDNCGIRSINYNITGTTSRSGNTANASGTFNPGYSTINWLVIDIHGNTSSCTTAVVIDKVDASVEDVYASGITSAIGQPNTIYIGYGGTSLTYNSVTTSSVTNNSFTYRWTIGSPSGTLVGTSSSITVYPTATTVYYLTIKDVNNCKPLTQIVKQVNVVNIVCGSGKITVCLPQKNGSPVTSCVSSSSSSINKLPSGWYLGSCIAPVYVNAKSTNNTSITVNHAEIPTDVSKDFKVIVSPNPSVADFKIQVQSNSSDEISIRLQDVSGRVIHTINKIQKNQSVSLGKNLIAGIYFAEVIQGRNKKIIRLIKL